MGWGEAGPDDASPRVDPDPVPVPPGAVRLVRVVLHGFRALPADPLLVMWDDRRAAVRLPDGRLRWYADQVRQAHPVGGSIVVEESGVYPRDNRAMDALAVRSLHDLMETVDADEVLRSAETGVVLRASGRRGSATPWRLEVLETRLVEGRPELLEPVDVTPVPW